MRSCEWLTASSSQPPARFKFFQHNEITKNSQFMIQIQVATPVDWKAGGSCMVVRPPIHRYLGKSRNSFLMLVFINPGAWSETGRCCWTLPKGCQGDFWVFLMINDFYAVPRCMRFPLARCTSVLHLNQSKGRAPLLSGSQQFERSLKLCILPVINFYLFKTTFDCAHK